MLLNSFASPFLVIASAVIHTYTIMLFTFVNKVHLVIVDFVLHMFEIRHKELNHTFKVHLAFTAVTSIKDTLLNEAAVLIHNQYPQMASTMSTFQQVIACQCNLGSACSSSLLNI